MKVPLTCPASVRDVMRSLTFPRRTKLPSATELLSSALVPRRSRSASFSFPFSKAFRRDFHILPVPNPVSNPPTALPQGPSASHLAITMYPYQAHQGSLQDATNTQQRPADGAKREPQRYPAPHPNMYPIPPPPMMAFPTQPLPLETYQQQPLPPGARIISPPRFPNPDELKYKCSVCGRFRSPRYHYRHPIPPGELPRQTVCRKCREEATDSEDDDSFEERRVPRARSRSLVRVVEEPRRARMRSLSRGYDVLPRRYARSRSSSRENRRVRVVEEVRPPRRRSPGVELVRYAAPRPRRRRSSVSETIYVESDRQHRSSSSYEDDLYVVSDDEYDCPPRSVLCSSVCTLRPSRLCSADG